MVITDHIAGPVQQKPRYEILTGIARDAAVNVALNRDALERVEAVGERAERSGDLVDVFYDMQLQATVAEPANLAQVVKRAYIALTEIPLENRPNSKPFSDAGVHLIRRSDVLLHRIKLPGVLLRIAHDEILAKGDIRHIRELHASGERIFSSGEDLLPGYLLLDTYIGPLLGAMTPAIWAFASHRTFGPILFSLGRPVNGFESRPTELMHLLPSRKPIGMRSLNGGLKPSVFSETISWWRARLNDLFGVLSDFAIFVDANGFYSPIKHLQTLLTVEQLFRRVSSILTSLRDAHAQMVLLFTVLDTIERLTGRNIEMLCTLSFAEKRMENLRAVVPDSVSVVLLPLAERAVVALRELQDGFFIHRSSSEVMVAGMSKQAAAARYIKLLRNATHGHGARAAGVVDQTNSLLAQHNGDMPHDLSFIGYLYLLDWIARPEDYRRSLSRRR